MIRPLEFLLDLLYPPKCVFCRKILKSGEQGYCGQCQTTLPWLEGAAAEQSGEAFALCVSPLRYQGVVRDSLRRYKFEGRQEYAKTYGRLLAQCIQDHLSGRYDLITWAPLSAARKKERGYDQAFLLAQAAARELGVTAVGTLRKHRNTTAQSGLTEDGDRRNNVLDAYEAVDPELVRDKRILIVDDIVTTGSTLNECAKPLRAAGAREILCASLARAR